MSKKSKKRYSNLPIDRKLQVKKSISNTSEFNPDYSYVKKDLRRIGSLAAFFFVILIILTFILR
jgi:hypothetical protein